MKFRGSDFLGDVDTLKESEMTCSMMGNLIRNSVGITQSSGIAPENAVTTGVGSRCLIKGSPAFWEKPAPRPFHEPS